MGILKRKMGTCFHILITTYVKEKIQYLLVLIKFLNQQKHVVVPIPRRPYHISKFIRQ